MGSQKVFAQMLEWTMRRTLPWLPVWFCVESYIGTFKVIDGRSMQPTLNSRGRPYTDVVVLDKWNARQLNIRRGDVVVLRSPHNEYEQLAKRVVGLPGDVVKPRPNALEGDEPRPIPRGQIWVEGDNDAASNDSNSFGSVAAALVEARVRYKVWPISERGPVEDLRSAEQRELVKSRLIFKGQSESVAGAAARSAGSLSWHMPRRL